MRTALSKWVAVGMDLDSNSAAETTSSIYILVLHIYDVIPGCLCYDVIPVCLCYDVIPVCLCLCTPNLTIATIFRNLEQTSFLLHTSLALWRWRCVKARMIDKTRLHVVTCCTFATSPLLLALLISDTHLIIGLLPFRRIKRSSRWICEMRA
jgi:hypothetical protein